MKKYLLPAVFSLLASASLLIPSAALDISAQSAILTDLDSGRVLYEKNSGERRAIASITKIMTALVALEHCDLEELVTVSYESTLTEGSSMYLKPGEILSMEELLYGLMLASGNDAALAVAQHCAGSVGVFVDWMNEKARQLRMNDTQFKNPNGLDEEGHYSTAADMAKLTAAAMNNDTFVRIVSTKTITIGSRSLKNHNKLLWEYDGVLGVKTGYTGKAGRTLVSCASRDGQRLIAVTLSDRNDWVNHTSLFDYGFQTYPKTVLCKAGWEMGEVTVTGGMKETVPVTAAVSLNYPLGKGEMPEIKFNLPLLMKAPVARGAFAGRAVYLLNGAVIGSCPLVFAESVDRMPTRMERILSGVRDLFD